LPQAALFLLLFFFMQSRGFLSKVLSRSSNLFFTVLSSYLPPQRVQSSGSSIFDDMKKISYAFLFSLFFFISPANADSLSSLDIERASLRSLSFTATIETPKPNGRMSKMEMKYYYLSPNKFRSELKMGIEGNLLTVSDGTFIWSWQNRTKKLYRQARNKLIENFKLFGPFDPITAFSAPDISLSELFELKSSLPMRNSERKLILTPKKNVGSYDRIELIIEDNGKKPVQATVWKKNILTAKITFTNYIKNPQLSNSLFVFEPPRGIRINELR